MQKIAYIQYTIKDMCLKFSVLQEALQHQKDQFEQLKVVRRIGPAYRECLAEVVRRKAAMKLYMGKAGQLAEKLAMERDAEISRREKFLKVHSSYIPQDILASMGLYDNPNPCDVNVTPFDFNLLDIDISDLERYAPESLLGFSSKREKHGTFRGSLSMSHDGSQAAEIEGTVDFSDKYDSQESLEGSELVEVAGTSKMEVENAKLKAELASKIALICSMCADHDYESLDDTKLDSILKNAAERTSEALHLKDEYVKHLQSMLKVKQMQCESYEKQVHELEQRLSDEYMRGCKLSADEDVSDLVVSTTKTEDNNSEVTGVGESDIHHTMGEVSCASSSLKSSILPEHDKAQGLYDNMTDSSDMLNSQLDSSMLDLHRDKDKRETPLPDRDMALAASNMAVSMSQPADIVSSETAILPGLDTISDSLLLELQYALAEKTSQLDNAENKIQALLDEVSNLGRELEIKQKMLNESQVNCAHLEKCLHEAREEAPRHLRAADCRASECSALRASAVKMHGLFERLRSCVSLAGVAAFADTLRALASSANESEGDSSIAEFHECVRMLADKVGILSRQREELLERYSTVEDANEQLNKALEEKKALLNTLYMEHKLEKQATREKISFSQMQVHEIAAFVLNSSGHYEAIHRNCPYYFLSSESVALFTDHLPSHPSYIVGQVVHIERQMVKSDRAESSRNPVDILTLESGTSQLTLTPGPASNPYGLPVGCEYFVVTIAIFPDTTAS
ncbi:hypothetical protein CDL12_19199 [Handroanthus impetiginosus]|uniref:Autophagy-related protein 11 C-terminal domain-containing protein n=1 Tax=Handroanthus impetiginosus TaxID=429701 RepID=A0A2G9GSP8_9LAMI|nr:hypothetical protein CDL12_19199 [Handroanthus impetiginosus]